MAMIQISMIKTITVRYVIYHGICHLTHQLTSSIKCIFVTGAYRALEDETGDFWNDSLIKLKRYSIYNFGESGTIDLSGQLTIPTSEASRDDDLQTALRIDLPVGFKVLEADISVSPRIRKKTFTNIKLLVGVH